MAIMSQLGMFYNNDNINSTFVKKVNGYHPVIPQRAIIVLLSSISEVD